MTGDAYIDGIVAGLVTALGTVGMLLISARWALWFVSSSSHSDSE